MYEKHINVYYFEFTKNSNHRLWRKKMSSMGMIESRGTVKHCICACDRLPGVQIPLLPWEFPYSSESKGTAAKIKLASDPFLVSFFSHVSSGSSGFFAYFFMPSQIFCAFLQLEGSFLPCNKIRLSLKPGKTQCSI